MVVQIRNERYLTDVGIRSESPRTPIKLVSDELQSDGICEYRFRQDPFYGWVLCQKERRKAWRAMYGFTEEQQIDDDFVMPSFYCEKHMDLLLSFFLNFTLVNGVFQEYRNAKVQLRKKLKSKSETSDILKTYFGLDEDFDNPKGRNGGSKSCSKE